MTRSVGWAGLHRTTCVRRCVVAHVQVRTRRDGSRSYKVVWRVGGKEVSKTFRRRREADAYKTEMEHQLNVGTYVDPNRGKVTLAEFWHYFLATSGPASPSTRALYGMQARRYLIPLLGHFQLRALPKIAVKEALGRLRHKGVGLPSVVSVHRLLR